MCKVVTGNFFTIAGDMLAQTTMSGGGGHGDVGSSAVPAGRKPIDLWRTSRLCIETSLLGTPLAHWWFGMLDGRIMPEDPHNPVAVMSKMLLDQVFFAPAGLLMFFVAIKLLEGRPRDIPRTIKTSYVKALLGGYLLWPAAGILNFALLPPEYRLLFNNCVNILWTCFLSIMSSGGAEDGATAAEPEAAAAPMSTLARDLAAAAAVTAAAVSATAGRPSFALAAGVAVAMLDTVFETHRSSLDETDSGDVSRPVAAASSAPQAVAMPVLAFAAGAPAACEGLVLEVCSQRADALH